MHLKIKRINEDVKLPVKMSDKAACYDVYAHRVVLSGANTATVYTGLIMIPPKGYKIVLVPRSSLTKYSWVIQNSPGQGDEDFRGEYRYIFRVIPVLNGGHIYNESFPYKVGDRIGQIYIQKVEEFEIEEVTSIDETNRGIGGFGSTGK